MNLYGVLQGRITSTPKLITVFIAAFSIFICTLASASPLSQQETTDNFCASASEIVRKSPRDITSKFNLFGFCSATNQSDASILKPAQSSDEEIEEIFDVTTFEDRLITAEMVNSSITKLIEKIQIGAKEKRSTTAETILISQLIALFEDLFATEEAQLAISPIIENLDEITLAAVRSGPLATLYWQPALGIISRLEPSSPAKNLLAKLQPHTEITEILFPQKENCFSAQGIRSLPVDEFLARIPKLYRLTIHGIDFYGAESFSAPEATSEITARISQYNPLATSNSQERLTTCVNKVITEGEYIAPYTNWSGTLSQELPLQFPTDISLWSNIAPLRYHDSELTTHSTGVQTWYFRASQRVRLDLQLHEFPFSVEPTVQGITIGHPYQNTVMIGVSELEKERLFESTETELPNYFTDNAPIKGEFGFPEIYQDKDEQDINTGSYNIFDFYFYVDPNTNYFSFKLVLPTIIFVLVSLITLIRPKLDSEAHLQVATTVLVALVAYQFIVNEELPQLPYMTTLDIFLISMLGSAALNVVANLMPHLSETKLTWLLSENTYNVIRVLSLSLFIYGIGTIVAGFVLSGA